MEETSKKKKDCCSAAESNVKDKRGLLAGIVYGLLPHSFCIAFVVFSAIGATTGALVFKKFLLVSYFFQILVLVSFVFATISAVIYLKRNGILSWQGIKRSRDISLSFMVQPFWLICFSFLWYFQPWRI